MSTKIGTDALVAYERGLALLVVATVVEATPHIGRPPSRGFIVAVLSGSASRDVIAADAHRLGTYGALAALGPAAIHELVDALVAKGFLEVVRSRRTIVCTTLGRSLAEGHVMRPLGILPGAVEQGEFDLAVRAGLCEALRRHRAEAAHAREIPERLVFSETTLRELATRRPTTQDELASVPGVGPKLLGLDGAELLRIVAEHLPIIERLRVAVNGATVGAPR